MLEYTITMRGDDDAEAAIRKALKALGCDNIEIMSYIPFEDYLKTLGTSPVKGLAREMSSWFMNGVTAVAIILQRAAPVMHAPRTSPGNWPKMYMMQLSAVPIPLTRLWNW